MHRKEIVKNTLPWHLGFHNEIADNLCEGVNQESMVRYKVWSICDNAGRHVAWVCSPEHAAVILDAANSLR
jgi:hypothetical protein